MKLYLDTCRIQDLYTNNGDAEIFIKKLLTDKKITLVYSWINLSELTDRDDKDKILQIAEFISTINPIYLKNSFALWKNEFLCSLNKTSFNPFSENLADVFLGFKSVEAYINTPKCTFYNLISEMMKYSIVNNRIKRLNQIVKEWGENNAKISKTMSKDKFWKSAQRKFTEKAYHNLAELISDPKIFSTLPHQKSKKSIKIPKIEPSMVWSYSVPFFVLYMKHRDSNRNWNNRSHLWDIEHCTAAPFVDFFVTDTANSADLNSVLKYLKFDRTKVYPSLDTLYQELQKIFR